MENKKGSGAFLGVVSVATLVVAIIGSTFAYFSSQTNSAEGAISASAYEFNVTIDEVTRINPTNEQIANLNGLIPLNPTKTVANASEGQNTNLLYALNVGGKTAEDSSNIVCQDDNGYQVCALYKAKITNGGTQPVTLSLEVKTNTNTAGSGSGAEAFSDLTFQQVTGSTGAYTLKGVAATLLAEGNTTTVYDAYTSESDNTPATITVAGSTSVEHYFVIYLNETDDDDDQSAQMGASYTGQLVYTTSTGGNRLTGTFTVAGE